MSRTARGGVALIAAAFLVALAASAALAQDELLGGKLRTGDTITIGADESVDGDLYVLGGTVTVDGSIDGDLTTLGGQVLLNGTVTGDVLAAGGTVSIAGTVEGDVRTTGGQVTMNGSVGEDVIVAGGQITLQGGADVGGDLVASGGQVTMAGAIGGSIEANAGTYDRTGTVGGTEHVVLQSQGQDDGDGAETTAGVFDAVRHFVVLVILGALILLVVPRFLETSGTTLRQRPAAALGLGLLTIVGFVVFLVVAILAIVLLAIAFGLAQLGALAFIVVVGGLLTIFSVSFVFAVLVAFIADLVVSFAIVRLVATGAAPAWWQQLGLLAAGAAVVVLVTSLPIIGGIAKLLVVLFGLGAIALVAFAAWRGRRAPTTPPTTAVPAG